MIIKLTSKDFPLVSKIFSKVRIQKSKVNCRYIPLILRGTKSFGNHLRIAQRSKVIYSLAECDGISICRIIGSKL